MQCVSLQIDPDYMTNKSISPQKTKNAPPDFGYVVDFYKKFSEKGSKVGCWRQPTPFWLGA